MAQSLRKGLCGRVETIESSATRAGPERAAVVFEQGKYLVVAQRYSLLAGGGVFGNYDEPLRPTQRFWNLKQLGSTPPGLPVLPVEVDRPYVTAAALGDDDAFAVHLVNNGATGDVVLTGLPETVSRLQMFVTDAGRAMEEGRPVPVTDGEARFTLESQTFTTLLQRPRRTQSIRSDDEGRPMDIKTRAISLGAGVLPYEGKQNGLWETVLIPAGTIAPRTIRLAIRFDVLPPSRNVLSIADYVTRRPVPFPVGAGPMPLLHGCICLNDERQGDSDQNQQCS